MKTEEYNMQWHAFSTLYINAVLIQTHYLLQSTKKNLLVPFIHSKL